MNAVLNAPPSPKAVNLPNYPRNCWWIAALSAELTDAPIGRWLLDSPVVLYRKSDGSVAALEDRCPHRWAPLSLGRVTGDNIVCPYHGFEFASHGGCVKIPSQDQIPPKAKVEAYPVVEQDGFVWVWLGDAAMAADQPPPALSWVTDPRYSVIIGKTEIRANYMAMKENVLDLTHLPVLHAATLLVNDWDEPPEVTVDGDVVTYSRHFTQAPLAPSYGIPGVQPGTPVDRYNYGSFISPAVQTAGVDFKHPAPKAGELEEFHFRVCHATTPVSPDETIYYWAIANNWGPSGAKVVDFAPPAALEDKVILEAVQEVITRDRRGRNAPEISVRADQAALQARRILQRLLDAENSGKDGPHVP